MDRKLLTIAILAFVFGLAIELSVSLSTDHIEAWDWSGYFTMLLPLQAVIWGFFAWFAPRRFWMWPLVGVMGRMLGMGIASGNSATLFIFFPMGLFFMLPELILFEVASLIAGLVSRRLKRKAAERGIEPD